MNIWVLLYRAAWIVVAVAIAIALICIFLPQASRFRELQGRKLVLQETNARMETRLRELDENRRHFHSDPEFVERVAREQGMAKPGETIFRFEGTNAHVVVRQP